MVHQSICEQKGRTNEKEIIHFVAKRRTQNVNITKQIWKEKIMIDKCKTNIRKERRMNTRLAPKFKKDSAIESHTHTQHTQSNNCGVVIGPV